MQEGEERMIYAMSDIHGNYELMEERITQLRPLLANTDDRLLLLGDFIDRGNKSYQCLQMAYDFEKEFGSDKTAYVLAIGTISDKGTIDEIGRALSDKWTQSNAEYQAEYERICNTIEELSKNDDANSRYGIWATEEFGYRRLREIRESAKNPYSLDNLAVISFLFPCRDSTCRFQR